MKYTLPIALLAVAASAAAIKEEDKRWCSTPGQACDTVKRAAEAFAEALKSTNGLAARDGFSGEAAVVARSQVDELALAISASQPNPRAFYDNLNLGHPTDKREATPQWCLNLPGQPCWKRDVVVREAEADAEPQWCVQLPGQSCWKRDASPEALEEHKRCIGEGQSCWKARRAAEAVLNAIDAGNRLNAKREATPQWCLQLPGQPCWKRAQRS